MLSLALIGTAALSFASAGLAAQQYTVGSYDNSIQWLLCRYSNSLITFITLGIILFLSYLLPDFLALLSGVLVMGFVKTVTNRFTFNWLLTALLQQPPKAYRLQRIVTAAMLLFVMLVYLLIEIPGSYPLPELHLGSVHLAELWLLCLTWIGVQHVKNWPKAFAYCTAFIQHQRALGN